MGLQTGKNGKTTIGVLINQIGGRYQSYIMTGLYDFARKNNINLIFYAGSALYTPYPEEMAMNVVYQLVNPELLDGLIIASSCLGNYAGTDRILQFLEPFRPLPMISLSYSLPGIPGVISDNQPGIQELMIHLAEFHKYRHIGFVRGPQTNFEAEERFTAYCNYLTAHQIPVNPNLIFQGDFSYQSGVNVARQLLQKKPRTVDALVVGNDEMALAIYRELQKNGVMIPRDLAIVGYDDIKDVQIWPTSFTTVHQPLYEQGQKAGELMLNLLQGRPIAPVTPLAARVVIRGSCGCSIADAYVNNHPKNGKFNIEFAAPQSIPQLKKRFLASDPLLLPELLHLFKTNLHHSTEPESLVTPQLTGLIDSFMQELRGQNKPLSFVRSFHDLVTNGFQYHIHTDFWQECLTLLKEYLLDNLDDTHYLILGNDLILSGQLLLGKIREHALENTNILHDSLFYQLKTAVDKVTSSIEDENLMQILQNHLPALQIPSCYISLYEKDISNTSSPIDQLPPTSRLMMAYNTQGSLLKAAGSPYFFSHDLLPVALMKDLPQILLVHPLVSQNCQFGTILYELAMKELFVFEPLRELISNALFTHQLFKENLRARTKLANTLDALRNSEERFRTMANLFPTIIAETGLDMEITYLNQAGITIFGIQHNTLPDNLMLPRFVHEDDCQEFQAFSLRALKEGNSSFHEFRFRDRSGAVLHLICKVQNIVTNDRIEGLRWSIFNLKTFLESIMIPDDLMFQEYRLSPREREVADLMLQGLRAKDIAGRLFISEYTVKDHIKQIYAKIGASDRSSFFEKVKSFQIDRFGHNSFVLTQISKLIRE